MNDFVASECYQHCQALFDRWYPGFRDAGQQYQDIVAALVGPRTTLLEVGCGCGSLASGQIRAAERSVGIDLNLPDLRRNKVVAHCVLGDGGALPFPARSFDLVASQWVVEHLEDPERVFLEMARVLRLGGQTVLLTTNANSYVPLLSRFVLSDLQKVLIERFLRRPSHESFPTFYRANTPGKLAYLAGQSGLKLEECIFVGNPFYLAFSPLLFRLALFFEKLTDHPAVQRFKLYILAVLHKM